MRVGFIGLGRMGKPMARNLLRAGHDLVVHNRSQGVVQELALEGAHPASSAAEVAERADVVLTCLPDIPTVRQVVEGPQGVLAAARPGLIVVDLSTIDPDTARHLAERASGRGAFFLDAPVSGGVEGARAGTLTIMVGGDTEAFNRVLPVLEALGKTVRLVGPSGAGTVAKPVNQLLTSVHTVAALEAIALGARAGADPRVLYELIRVSYGASRMWERNVPRVLERHFPSEAPIRLLYKDQVSIQELARSLGLTLAVSEASRRFWQRAIEEGLGEEDIACAVQVLEPR